MCLPLRGLSPLGAPGQPFHDPEADFALIETLRENLREGVRVLRMAASSDDAPFIEACVEELFRNMARRERDRDFLRRIEFFRGASELLLSDAIRFTESRVVGGGEYLLRAGAPVDALFVLVSGTLEVREGGERRGKLGGGAVCGEDAFVSGVFGELEVRTLESCEVLRLRRSGVEQLRRRYPDFNARFLAAREALLTG